MEVHDLVAHVLKHSVERQVVVLPEGKLEESHVFLLLIAFISQLVMQEAAEKLDVALLRVNCECLLVARPLFVVVVDRVFVRGEHAQEHEQGANHHACATLASLAVDHYHRLEMFHLALVLVDFLVQLVVLLHTLKEESRVHAERKYFLQVGDVVVEEGELADGELPYCLL